MTVISTMKKEINSDSVQFNEQVILVLENEVIAAIIYHEFGHAINAIIIFHEIILPPYFYIFL